MPLTPEELANIVDCLCPSPIQNDTFKTYVLQALASINTNTAGGGGGGGNVNLTGVNGVAPSVNNGTADAGTLRVTLASNSTGQVAIAGSLPAGTNNIGDVDVLSLPSIPTGANTIGSIASVTTSIVPGTAATNLGKAEDSVAVSGDTGVAILGVRNDNGATLTSADGDYGCISLTRTGSVQVAISAFQQADTANTILKLVDGVSGAADAGVAMLVRRTDTPVANAGVSADGDYLVARTDNFGRTWAASVPTPQANGGLTTTKLISAATTNATVIKGSAGRLYSVQAGNNGAAIRYLKLYNKATAPTVGTDIPVKTIPLPANGVPVALDFGSHGVAFSLGIGIALTAGITDADTAAVAVNECAVNIDYA